MNEIATSFEDRWQEINVLIQKASEEEHSNITLYDALCRATSILLVAQLEAFIKDITKAIIYDINKFSSFSKSPMPLKRTFCRVFIESGEINSRDIEERIVKLIKMLDDLDTKFSFESFLLEGQYGSNRNPSSGVISKICNNFGVRNIFSWINNTRLDIVFNDVRSEVDSLITEMRNYIIENTDNHPYTLDMNVFGIVEPTQANPDNASSFWKTFLDNLLKSRHDIAHGSNTENTLSIGELTSSRDKIVILEYALILILCHKSRPIA